MKKKDKKYVDQQILWVRELKRTENYWLEKYLESEQRTQKEEMKSYKESTETWKIGIVEQIRRIESTATQAVPRREMRTIIISVITILIASLGLLAAIFLKK